MSWNQVTAADVLSEFTPAEKAALQNIQANDYLPDILARVIASARGSIAAGGYTLGDEGTIPDQLREDVIAIARWRFLTGFPQMKSLQTDARKALADKAEERLEKVSNQELNVESPSGTAVAAGSWNSENKIVPRAHPLPRPGTQQQGNANDYANPDAPSDKTTE